MLLFAGLATAAWNTVSAQDPPPPPPARTTSDIPPPPPPPPPPDDQEEFQGAARGLNLPDLTADQQEKIKKLRLAGLEKMTPLKNQLKEKRAHLASLLTEKNVNMTEVNKTADEIGGLMAQMLKNSIGTDQAIRALLTDEQRVIFDSRPKPFLNPLKPKVQKEVRVEKEVRMQH